MSIMINLKCANAMQPVDVCIQKYLEFSKSVFRLDKKMLVPVGDGNARFSSEPLEKALKKVVVDMTEPKDEEAPLADNTDDICPVFVVSTRGQVAGPVKLFRSYGFHRDRCPIWQAARATTAAPTYFPPAWVTLPSPAEWYIDGGVTQNNPSPVALKEAKELWKAKRCFLVSVGTGIQKHANFIGKKKPPDESKAQAEPEQQATTATSDTGKAKTSSGERTKGLLQATTSKIGKLFRTAKSPLRTAADKAAQVAQIPAGISTSIRFAEQLVKLSTESEKTNGNVYAEAHSGEPSVQFPYFRFNVQNGMEEIGLEEWDNWVLITGVTRTYLESVDIPTKLEECAKALLHPPGFESR
jgi:predicted acylesterase/phospholipase RssA